MSTDGLHTRAVLTCQPVGERRRPSTKCRQSSRRDPLTPGADHFTGTTAKAAHSGTCKYDGGSQCSRQRRHPTVGIVISRGEPRTMERGTYAKRRGVVNAALPNETGESPVNDRKNYDAETLMSHSGAASAKTWLRL
jgi:hypothetical protein